MGRYVMQRQQAVEEPPAMQWGQSYKAMRGMANRPQRPAPAPGPAPSSRPPIMGPSARQGLADAQARQRASQQPPMEEMQPIPDTDRQPMEEALPMRKRFSQKMLNALSGIRTRM